MEESIKKYHPLGQKTLFMLILKRAFFLIPLWLIFVIGIFVLAFAPVQYISLATNIFFIYSFILLLFSLLILSLGWLEYYRYWIFIDDKDFKIARGLIATEQIGLPYRRIKDLKIQRSLLDQIIGVSDVIITILGSEDNEVPGQETIIVLPSLSQEIALQIQDIVLKKVQVEQVNVLSSQTYPQRP